MGLRRHRHGHNLAARLCADAKPGQILVAQRLLAAVEALFEADPVASLR
jgi:class 3 adenylate cyclase